MGWPTFSGFIDGGECVIFFNRPKLLLEGRRGGWVEWETSLDTNFFRSRVSRREPRWLTIQKRRWLGRGGEEGYLHARLYACTRVLPLFFRPFIAREKVLSRKSPISSEFFFLIAFKLAKAFSRNLIRISEWKQGLEFYKSSAKSVRGFNLAPVEKPLFLFPSQPPL